MPKDIKEDDFKSEVEEYKGVTIVDFWAAWCPPCQALGPILEQVESEAGDKAKLVKVNVDENQKIAMEHEVRGIPTVKIFKDGKEVETLVGLAPKAHYLTLIDKYSS